MSKLIYIHNDDNQLFDCLLNALKSHAYEVEFASNPGTALTNGIHADMAFFYAQQKPTSTLTVGDITLDMDNVCAVRQNGETIHLTPIEFAMLSYLMQNSHRAVSRKELLPIVWNMEYDGRSRVADDTAKRLRKKLHGSAMALETVWNYGFRLVVRG